MHSPSLHTLQCLPRIHSEVLRQPLHIAQCHLQLWGLLDHGVHLPTKLVEVALEHVVLVALSCFLLLWEALPGLQNLILLLQVPHLVAKGGKLAAKGGS